MPHEPFEVLADNYPSNSKKSKLAAQEIPDERRQKKVITGNVKKKKRGLGKKMTDVFMEENARSAGGYIFHDVLIPALKSLVCDMVGWGGMAEMILFGDKRGGQARRNGGRPSSYRSYDKVSYRRDDYGRDRDRGDRDISRRGRTSHNFDEVVMDRRADADEVLSRLYDTVLEYRMVSVADFYDMVGIPSNFTDTKWGWTDLDNARVMRVRDGYIIDLPRTQLLD